MGRTLQTATMLINSEVARWGKFRRSLRAEDKEVLDSLLSKSKHHFSAIGYASILDTFQAMMVSILLEQEKRIRGLEDARGATGRHRRRR